MRFHYILVAAVFFSVTLSSSEVRCVVSIPPLKTFVDSIGGKHVDTSIMVPPGNSPHTYEPKPSQMQALEKAQCYFAIGVEFEKAWLPRFSSQNPKMIISDLSLGIEKIAMVPSDRKKSFSKTRKSDPHIWSSPENVRKMGAVIRDVLSSIDPAHAEDFRRNYNRFNEKISNLDKKLRLVLGSTRNKKRFLVFHPSWGYFARDYGLIQVAVETGGKNPKPRQLMKLVEQARRDKIKAIFVQPEFSEKSATLLAKELEIPVIRISPMSMKWFQNLLRLARGISGEKQ